MAKIVLAAPIAGIRGTVNGLIYSANGATPYVKRYAFGPNPRTSRQQTERSNFAAYAAAWAALSSSDQGDWDTYAADPAQELTNSLGEAYYVSGFNWFVGLSTQLQRVGRAALDPAPSIAQPAAPAITELRITQSGSESDLCTGGTATASSTAAGSSPDNAFDDNPATFWRTVTSTIAAWLQYEFAAAQTILKYAVTCRDDDTTTAPLDWTFEYWDGAMWQIVDTQIDQSFSVGETKTYFSIDPGVTSTMWRLNVTDNNGGVNTGLAELEMFAGLVDASVIIYPANEFITGGPWDAVLHIANKPTTGAAVAYRNYAEIIATQTPGNTSIAFQDALEDIYGTIIADRTWWANLYRQTDEGRRSAPMNQRTISV